MHKHVLHVLSLQRVLIGLRSHGVDHETTGNISLDVLDCQQGRYGVGSKHGLVRRTVPERGDQGVVIIKPPLQPNVSRRIAARRRRRIRSCRGCGVRQSAGAVDDDMHVETPNGSFVKQRLKIVHLFIPNPGEYTVLRLVEQPD